MTESLRALASVADAEKARRARAHTEAQASEARARAALEDAVERCREAEARLVAAGTERGGTAAERVLADARRARLRERVDAARQVRARAEAEARRALEMLDRSRAELGSAHGEKKVVDAAIERAVQAGRAERQRREDDEADDLGRGRGR